MCSACQRCPRKSAYSLSRLLAHFKAGVHWRRRRSQNGIQKRRAIRCCANQTGGVGSRTEVLLMTSSHTVVAPAVRAEVKT